MLQEEKPAWKLAPKFAARVKVESDVYKVDAEGLYYRDLNCLLRAITKSGAKKAEIHGVCGQRYIGTDLDSDIQIDIYGTPGDDFGAFMNGPRLIVDGDAQD